MPLRECPDCAAMVSTDAKKCPQCGSMNLPLYTGDKMILTKHALVALFIVVPLVFVTWIALGFNWLGIVVVLLLSFPVHGLLTRIVAKLW